MNYEKYTFYNIVWATTSIPLSKLKSYSKCSIYTRNLIGYFPMQALFSLSPYYYYYYLWFVTVGIYVYVTGLRPIKRLEPHDERRMGSKRLASSTRWIVDGRRIVVASTRHMAIVVNEVTSMRFVDKKRKKRHDIQKSTWGFFQSTIFMKFIKTFLVLNLQWGWFILVSRVLLENFYTRFRWYIEGGRSYYKNQMYVCARTLR